MNAALIRKIENNGNELQQALDTIKHEWFNVRPAPDSWSAAEVSEHLLKSERGVAQNLLSPKTATDRNSTANVPILESIFLNFDHKLNSPDFILPSTSPKEKSGMMLSLAETRKKIIDLASEQDLSLTCTAFGFPKLGSLTGIEFLHFLIYHTTRHIRQLNRIANQLAEQEMVGR